MQELCLRLFLRCAVESGFFRFMPSPTDSDWTPEEIAIEKEYRRQERIGISCGAEPPSTAILARARREADEWEAQLFNTTTNQQCSS